LYLPLTAFNLGLQPLGQGLARGVDLTRECGPRPRVERGARHDRGTHRTRGTWGLGTEAKLFGRTQLIAETFGDSGERPFGHAGLRIWLVPDHLQVDTTICARMSGAARTPVGRPMIHDAGSGIPNRSPSSLIWSISSAPDATNAGPASISAL
jgi:hypothetical protein